MKSSQIAVLAGLFTLLCLIPFVNGSSASTLDKVEATASQEAAGGKAARKNPRKPNQAQPDDGSVANRVYSEKFFHLRYQIPSGWVVRTEEMRQGLANPDQAFLLLSTFQKSKPEPDQINPSVTITAESLELYPDVKTAEDYFDSVTDLVKSKGFSVLNEPAELDIGGVMFLRGDFQREQDDQTTYQATMVTIRKGYILQITAISGNDEDLTPLLARLRIFAPPTMKK